jgi:hypothetical protein
MNDSANSVSAETDFYVAIEIGYHEKGLLKTNLTEDAAIEIAINAISAWVSLTGRYDVICVIGKGFSQIGWAVWDSKTQSAKLVACHSTKGETK